MKNITSYTPEVNNYTDWTDEEIAGITFILHRDEKWWREKVCRETSHHGVKGEERPCKIKIYELSFITKLDRKRGRD